jgi:hypothetical protein
LWFLFFDLIYAIEILDGIKRFDSFWALKREILLKKTSWQRRTGVGYGKKVDR